MKVRKYSIIGTIIMAILLVGCGSSGAQKDRNAVENGQFTLGSNEFFDELKKNIDADSDLSGASFKRYEEFLEKDCTAYTIQKEGATMATVIVSEKSDNVINHIQVWIGGDVVNRDMKKVFKVIYNTVDPQLTADENQEIVDNQGDALNAGEQITKNGVEYSYYGYDRELELAFYKIAPCE